MFCNLRGMVLNNEPKLAKEIQDPKNALSTGKSPPSTCDVTAVIFSTSDVLSSGRCMSFTEHYKQEK